MTVAQQFTHADDLIAIWRQYAQTLLSSDSEEPATVCKSLVADEHAMKMITIACPMALLMEHRVYDVHSLEGLLDGSQQAPLTGEETAYVLLRPTPQSQDHLVSLIKRNMFRQHHIAFTNRSDDAALVSLAMHDTFSQRGLSSIAAIKDIFADFVPLDRHLFAIPPPLGAQAAEPVQGASAVWRKAAADAATAVAAALRCNPVFRYQAGSARAQEAAQAGASIVGASSNKRVYDFSKRCTVLVLDRCGDAVAPLVTPWTYAAMLHEHLEGGIRDNTVEVPSARGKAERFAVGPAVDEFYAEHFADDYGEIGKALGTAARRMFAAVEGLKANDGGELSVAQMRQKLDQGASSSAAKSLLARHMSLFEVAADKIKRRSLLDVCASEQNIAAGTEGSAAAIAAVKAAADLHARGATTSADVERLALLACLRFEERAPAVCAAAKGAAPASLDALSRTLLEFGGAARRPEDLFGGGLLGGVRRMMEGGEGGGSVYMQHAPLLARQLDAAADGKLDAKKYPVVNATAEDSQHVARQATPQIVVIMLGGATYSEAEAARKFNASRRRAERRANAVLGAHSMLNTRDFIDRLRQLANS